MATRLDDVLSLLVEGPGTAPTRQQSLQAAIEWSYRLLDDLERWLFERLSVFTAGFDLDAAEATSHHMVRIGASSRRRRPCWTELVDVNRTGVLDC
jgi:predicted ATPase